MTSVRSRESVNDRKCIGLRAMSEELLTIPCRQAHLTQNTLRAPITMRRPWLRRNLGEVPSSNRSQIYPPNGTTCPVLIGQKRVRRPIGDKCQWSQATTASSRCDFRDFPSTQSSRSFPPQKPLLLHLICLPSHRPPVLLHPHHRSNPPWLPPP